MRAQGPGIRFGRHVDIHKRRDGKPCRVAFLFAAIGAAALTIHLFRALPCIAQMPPTLAAPATQPNAIDTTGQIPADELARIDRTLLGDRMNAIPLPTLLGAQQLLEDFFASDSPGGRTLIIQKLNATGIDPNTLGRLCHVRLHWPALAGGVYYINEQFGPQRVRYFLGVPANYDRGQSWPLVIQLPTANAFLINPPPDGAQVAQIYAGWINDALAHHPDALVLMPLLNLDTLYGPGYPGMYSVIDSMLHAAERVNVDPARVYLVGHAMAANAVWNLALHFPTYFAAVNPMAGGAAEDWQRLRMMNLLNVYPVVWADSDDQVVPSRQSGQLVAILRNFKIDVSYTQTQGIGHAPTPEIVESEYRLLRGRVRTLYPARELMQSSRPDTIFNRIDWLQVYQETTPGDSQRVYFARAMGYMMVNQNTYKIDARLSKPNEFDCWTDNVESLRIFLNDHMVDLRKPVIVRVNGKVRFNGMVKPSIEQMLKDQIFLGRGWRYFTAHADVDFGVLDNEPMGKATTAPASQPTRGSIQMVMPDGSVKTISPGKTGNGGGN